MKIVKKYLFASYVRSEFVESRRMDFVLSQLFWILFRDVLSWGPDKLKWVPVCHVTPSFLKKNFVPA